jgi:dihydrofolate reductase
MSANRWLISYTPPTSPSTATPRTDGRIDWSSPDEEVFSFITHLERPAGTYLYGRRMYETMLYWETAIPGEGYVREFADMWRGADKVVYSRSLKSIATARTRLEPDFDPTAVRHLKAAAGPRITIGGADLAGQALAAGLVDEIRLLIAPVTLGGGKPWLSRSVNVALRLLEAESFDSGVVYLRYKVGSEP